MTEPIAEKPGQGSLQTEFKRFIEWSGAVREALENFKLAIGRLQDEDGSQWVELRALHRVLRECRERCSQLSECKASRAVVERLDLESTRARERFRGELKALEEKFAAELEGFRKTGEENLEKLRARHEDILKELAKDQVILKISRARIHTRLAYYGLIGGAVASGSIYILKQLFELWRSNAT